MSSKVTLQQYRERFGVELLHPPLDYGHHNMTERDLARYARHALREGKPVDWSEHLAPLPDGADS